MLGIRIDTSCFMQVKKCDLILMPSTDLDQYQSVALTNADCLSAS